VDRGGNHTTRGNVKLDVMTPPATDSDVRRMRRRRPAPAVLALCGLAVVLAACGSGAGIPTAFAPSGTVAPTAKVPAKQTAQIRAVDDRGVAIADARHLMSLVRLPKNATPLSPTAPKGAPALLRQPAQEPLTPYVAALTRFSVVPGSLDSVLAWLQANPPAGSSFALSGSSGGGTEGVEYSRGFSWPATKILDDRGILASAMGFGAGKTLVRFDAQVVYTPSRPAAEVLPAGVDRVELVVTLSTTHERHFTITNPSAITLLEKAIDSLSRPDYTENPGGPCLCGPGADQRLVAQFFLAGDTHPVAVVTDWPMSAEEGVGNVSFALGPKTEPILEDGHWSVAKVVERITGVHFAGVPR
jgi:hypothetical protein